jgi:hypothetical protein
MIAVHLILLAFAFVLFLLAGIGVVGTQRLNLVALGLAFLTAALWLH